MAYATQDDIVTIYSADALFVAERDGVVDGAAVVRALDSASGEIDSFIAVRVALPLPEVPDLLVQFAVDIALYRLASSAAIMSDELRQRYEDALAHLRRIAKGEAALVLPVAPDAEPQSPAPIVADGEPRLFTRTSLRGL